MPKKPTTSFRIVHTLSRDSASRDAAQIRALLALVGTSTNPDQKAHTNDR